VGAVVHLARQEQRSTAAELAARLRDAAARCERYGGHLPATDAEATLTAIDRLLGELDRGRARRPDDAARIEPRRWHVRLLGGFAVTLDGGDVTPPRGNGATIVKLLALRGPLSPDTVVDLLWPDADAATGGGRLRNTLSRLRQATGPLVRRTGGLLQLSPAATVDVDEFLAGATHALDDRHDDHTTAYDLVVGFGGELLPADRFCDWFDLDRERVLRTVVDLAGRAADAAERRGDLAAAVRALELALGLDPLHHEFAVRVAVHLVAQGHRSAGRAAFDRALAVSRELGVAPGAELRRLALAIVPAPAVHHPSFRALSA